MSKQPASRKQSATILHFKLPPDDERFASRNLLIANLFLSLGWAVDSGEIDFDDTVIAAKDTAMANKIQDYTIVVQAICEMPNEDIDQLRNDIDALEWDDKIAIILQYANEYIADEWS